MLEIVTKSPGSQLHVIALWTALSTTESHNHPRRRRLWQKHAGNCQSRRCMNRCSDCKRLPHSSSHTSLLPFSSAQCNPSFHGPGHHFLCSSLCGCILPFHFCGALSCSPPIHPSPHRYAPRNCQNRCWSGMSSRCYCCYWIPLQLSP